MRDLTKSFMSLSWAMSMFGLEQLRHLISSEDSGKRRDRIAEDFTTMAEATKERLSQRNASMYSSGNALQSDMVDLVFDIFRGDEIKPRKVIDRAADLVEDSASALRNMGGEKKKTRTPAKKRTRKTTAKPAAQAG